MSDYDFKTLNDKEFEILCADLFGEVEGVRFERFKAGRDGGVDGRYFASNGKEVVLQCKHWANTPVSQLIRKLELEEKPKLEKLGPSRYLLAVSNTLSRADKAAISKALHPHVKTESDIFGKEDINDLLRPRPALQRNHYKLWLNSVSVISHMLNKPIFERSSFSLEEAVEAAKRYVVTENHELAKAMLERLGVVIISGEPGIGKTTLAEHVCLDYVSSGFEFIKIVEEIKEAEAVFETEKKQIFYFDDFLGRNYLEAINGHEGSHIVQFIRRVIKSKNSRFILTSRSTILNQGKLLVDTFRHHNIDKNEFRLTIRSLSELDKAKILYNHLWHSSLRREFIDALYVDRRYRLIIQHPNYNPRLISFITDSDRVDSLEPDGYWSHILSTLSNPAEVWQNPFDIQQDDFGRLIVLLVALSGGATPEHEIAEAYARHIARPESASLKGHRDFLNSTRHLTGSLINRRIDETSGGMVPLLDLFNPSLGDYVLRRYASDGPTLRGGFFSLRTKSSISTIRDLMTNRIIAKQVASDIVQDILRQAVDASFSGYSTSYLTKAAEYWRIWGKGFGGPIAKKVVGYLGEEPLPTDQQDFVDLIKWGIVYDVLPSDVAIRVVNEACEQNSSNDEELKSLGQLLEMADSSHEDYSKTSEKFEAMVSEHVTQHLDNYMYEEEVFSDIGHGDDNLARSKVKDLVVSKLEGFGASANEWEVDGIIDNSEFDSKLSEHFNQLYEDEDSERESSGLTQHSVRSTPDMGDGIDDLFDRT